MDTRERKELDAALALLHKYQDHIEDAMSRIDQDRSYVETICGAIEFLLDSAEKESRP